jgi:hypothetical protein
MLQDFSLPNVIPALLACHGSRVICSHILEISTVSSLAVAWVAGNHAVSIQEVQISLLSILPAPGRYLLFAQRRGSGALSSVACIRLARTFVLYL